MGKVGTQVIGVPASIHLTGLLNHVTKVVMWSNNQNGLTGVKFLPVSGYKRGWLKETMLIWTLMGGHYLKDKLNITVIKKLEKYTYW